MSIKPPLGLRPEWRHKELRLQEIREAVQRYLDANEAVPVNWIAEEYALRCWLENREEEKKELIPDTPAPEQTTDNLLLKEIVRTTKNIFNTITEIKNKKKAIREEQTTKEGLWSDEEVADFVFDVYGHGDIRKQIRDFKASKQPRTPLFKTEDGVDIFYGDDYVALHEDDVIVECDKADMNSGKDGTLKYFSTREAAEAYVAKQSLSNTPKEEQLYKWEEIEKEFFNERCTVVPKEQPSKDRDWQIECFTDGKANYWRQRNGGYHSQPFQGDIELRHFLDHPEVYTISHFTRLSDSQMFCLREDTNMGVIFKIEVSKHSDDLLNIYVDEKDELSAIPVSLGQLKKLPYTKPAEQPFEIKQELPKTINVDFVDTAAEQPKEDRIEVSDMYQMYIDKNISNKSFLRVTFNKDVIDNSKYPAVKQAIEKVLNNETDDDFWRKVQSFYDNALYENQSKKYTQEQLDKAVEDAFNAARFVTPDPFGNLQFLYVHPNATDYLSSLKSQSSPSIPASGISTVTEHKP